MEPGMAWTTAFLKHLAPEFLETVSRTIAQVVQRGTQWSTPFLVPSGLTTRVTTAVAHPATHTMLATPRSPLFLRAAVYLDFMLRRVAVQELIIISHPKPLARSLHRQH